MSSLTGRFTESTDGSDEFVAELPRPVMTESRVDYVFRQDGLCYPLDPQYQRTWSPNVGVTAYSDSQQLSNHHELAWEFIAQASAAIEKTLRATLWEECRNNFEEFVEEMEIDDPDCQWESMRDVADWSSESSLDHQVYLYHVGLLDSANENIAHVVFTFDVGWDEEHGLCVVMEKDKVLAVNGAGDHRF